MKTMQMPPLVNTDLTPNEIIGFENMSIFCAHLSICFSPTNKGEFPHKRLDKEVGPKNRERIAKVLLELRENGFYPMSIDDKDKITWGVVMKSAVQVEFEKDLARYEKLPKEQLMKMARDGFREINKNRS